LETIKKLKKAGIHTYLFMSPIFPEFSEIENLIDEAKNYVDEFYFENLNVRANNQKAILDFVAKHKPELVNFYRNLAKNRGYWDKIEKDIREKCDEEGIKYKIFFHHGK